MNIIYIRTSTTEQNPQNQTTDCLSINQYGLYEIIEDRQSAWKDNKERDGFNRLIKLVNEKKLEHLIVWDLDRLYRNRKKLIDFFALCKIYGCQIHSYRQKWLEDINQMPAPFNEIMHSMMLEILGWIAEEESTKKSQRVKASLRKDGEVTISYKGNKWGRKAISNKVRSEVHLLHLQGLTMRQIASQVSYYDKNNNKKLLSIGLVHKILTNKVTEQTSFNTSS